MALPQVNASRYTTVVPSTGEKIEFRPFLVKEEKLLMVALESKDNKLIVRTLKDVILACTFDKVDVAKLASFDLEYLFLQLRAKSVGETAKIALKCTECDESMKHNVVLEDIKLNVPKDKKIVMLTDKVGIQFKYPSVNDMDELNLSDIEGLTQEQQLAATETLILISMDQIFDEDEVHAVENYTKDELIDFVGGLNSSQFQKVTEWFADMPALKHTLKWDCKKCEHSNVVELRGLQSFFT
tara:strand:+ start:577 stop:1299 length:723 start_codon:yes stop_codon:yes gene_type:complete